MGLAVDQVPRNSPLVEDPGCSSTADAVTPLESITLDSVDSMPNTVGNARPLTLRIYRASAPKEPHVQAEITVGGENMDVAVENENNLPVGVSIK